jgi:hypothetical protein
MQCKPNYPRLRLVIHNIATQCPSIRGMLTCNSPKAQSLILLRLALPVLFLSWMFPKAHRKTVIASQWQLQSCRFLPIHQPTKRGLRGSRFLMDGGTSHFVNQSSPRFTKWLSPIVNLLYPFFSHPRRVCGSANYQDAPLPRKSTLTPIPISQSISSFNRNLIHSAFDLHRGPADYGRGIANPRHRK